MFLEDYIAKIKEYEKQDFYLPQIALILKKNDENYLFEYLLKKKVTDSLVFNLKVHNKLNDHYFIFRQLVKYLAYKIGLFQNREQLIIILKKILAVHNFSDLGIEDFLANLEALSLPVNNQKINKKIFQLLYCFTSFKENKNKVFNIILQNLEAYSKESIRLFINFLNSFNFPFKLNIIITSDTGNENLVLIKSYPNFLELEIAQDSFHSYADEIINNTLSLAMNPFKKKEILENSQNSLKNLYELIAIYKLSKGFIENALSYKQLASLKLGMISPKHKTLIQIMLKNEGFIYKRVILNIFSQEKDANNAIKILFDLNILAEYQDYLIIFSQELLDFFKEYNFSENDKQFEAKILKAYQNILNSSLIEIKAEYLSFSENNQATEAKIYSLLNGKIFWKAGNKSEIKAAAYLTEMIFYYQHQQFLEFEESFHKYLANKNSKLYHDLDLRMKLFYLYSQINEAESLNFLYKALILAKETKNENYLEKLYFAISKSYFKQEDYQKSLEIILEFEESSQSNKNNKSKINYYIAKNMYFLKSYEAAKKYLDLSLFNLFKEAPNSQKNLLYGQINELLANLALKEKSKLAPYKDYLMKAFSNYAINNYDKIHDISYLLSDLAMELDINQALNLQSLSLNYYYKEKNEEYLSNISLILAKYFLENFDLAKAEKYILQAFYLLSPHRDNLKYFIIYAQIAFNKADFQKAITILKIILKKDLSKSYFAKEHFMLMLAESYLSLKDFKAGSKILEAILKNKNLAPNLSSYAFSLELINLFLKKEINYALKKVQEFDQYLQRNQTEIKPNNLAYYKFYKSLLYFENEETLQKSLELFEETKKILLNHKQIYNYFRINYWYAENLMQNDYLKDALKILIELKNVLNEHPNLTALTEKIISLIDKY